MEVWKPIAGWEGFYEVSDQGRVRSLTRTVVVRNPQGVLAPRTYTGRIIGAHISTNGYRIVTLTKPGLKPVCCNVHTLVLTAFTGPAPDGMECCHGPAGQTVNVLDNLRWGTRSSNSLDRHRDGTVPDNRGTRSPNAKLDDAAVALVRRLRGRVTQRDLAARMGVSHNAVGFAQRRVSYANSN